MGPTKWSYFYLYVILDIFSRRVVGWCVADAESATLFRPLFDDAVTKHNVPPGQLTLHADRSWPGPRTGWFLMLQSAFNGASFWTRAFAALVAGEIGYYWGHRLMHTVPLLWLFHAIHHSPSTSISWSIAASIQLT